MATISVTGAEFVEIVKRYVELKRRGFSSSAIRQALGFMYPI